MKEFLQHSIICYLFKLSKSNYFLYISAKHTTSLFYIRSSTRTTHINKPFMGLKYHLNFNCYLWSPTEGEYEFIADSRFLDIKATVAVLWTHMESLKSTIILVFFLMSQMNILLIHETKTTDATADRCTASSDYGIPPTNNIYIHDV